MQTLYPRRSLFRFRPVRLLRYGRGHGVHSPLAYRIVCTVAQPRAEYYLPAPLEDSLALWYRLAARCPLEALCCDPATPGASAAEDYGRLADSRLRVLSLEELAEMGDLSRVALYTDRPEEALRFLRVRDRAVLLAGIRRDEEHDRRFRQMVAEMSRGIVIDLYDEALLFSRNDNLYIYRSTV